MEAQRELEFNISTIDHRARRIIGTDCNGYSLLHLIYKWSYNHLNTSGWCYASKDKLGETIGISRATTYRYIKEFEEAGYLRKQPGTGQLQTTEKFNKLLEQKGVETDSIKMRQEPSQNETQYNNYNINNTPYNPPGGIGDQEGKELSGINNGDLIPFPSERKNGEAKSNAPEIPDNPTSSPKDTSLARDCRRIIEHLNTISGKRFSFKSKATQRLVKARLAEDHTVEDFFAVHENKRDWLNDPKWDKYYRPETLYAASHFESYLNEKPAVDPEAWRYGI